MCADDGTCSGELDRFKGLLQDVQGIVNFGSVNAATAGLEAEQLKQYEMDLGQLDMNGCGLQLVLLPYGANKAIKEDYLKWSGSLNDAKALQAWILDQVRCAVLCHAAMQSRAAERYNIKEGLHSRQSLGLCVGCQWWEGSDRTPFISLQGAEAGKCRPGFMDCGCKLDRIGMDADPL